MVHTWLASHPKLADPYAQDAERLHDEGDLLKAHSRVQQAVK